MKKYKGMTPHNDSKKGEIAKTVLMPGDPLRAKFIAENYLTNFKKVNNVRGMLAYTGKYKNKDVTIMGSGIGNPSMGIYSWELFYFYEVDNIIRIGSAAALNKNIKLFDIIVAEQSITSSTFHEAVLGKPKYKLYGSKSLVNAIKMSWNQLNLNGNIHYGIVGCNNAFYRLPNVKTKYKKYLIQQNVLGIEMESFALYTNAKALNKKAVAILSVSDHSITGQITTAKERQKLFTNMMELALDVAINLK